MSEDRVLATVNGTPITQEDVEHLLESLGPQRGQQFQSEEGKKRLLDELIRQELIYLDAAETGMEKEEGFQLQLEQVKANLLKQYALQKLFENIEVGEEEVIRFYNENNERFRMPDRIRASHILVDDEVKASKIAKELKEGLAFDEAARRYSKCPSSSNGGDLGSFTRGKMVPEFEQAAFAMDKGAISKPVKTQFGYHIIMVTDKLEAGISPLEEVRDQLLQQMVVMKQNEAYTNKTNELKRNFEVVIHP